MPYYSSSILEVDEWRTLAAASLRHIPNGSYGCRPWCMWVLLCQIRLLVFGLDDTAVRSRPQPSRVTRYQNVRRRPRPTVSEPHDGVLNEDELDGEFDKCPFSNPVILACFTTLSSYNFSPSPVPPQALFYLLCRLPCRTETWLWN